MLERVVYFLLGSLLVQGYRGVRRGSIAFPLLLAAVYGLGLIHPLYLAASILAVYAATRMLLAATYTSALAAIPAAWMALTQLILDALQGALHPASYISIALRSYAASMLALYTLHAMNPLELGFLIHRVTGSCTAAYIPAFLHKVLGQVLREGFEAVVSHRLKDVPAWRTLALMLVRSSELTVSIEEAVLLRLRSCNPTLSYSSRVLVVQTAGLTLALLAAILNPKPF